MFSFFVTLGNSVKIYIGIIPHGIWCYCIFKRVGYGTASLMFYPMRSPFPSGPVLLLDFSDVTQLVRRRDPTGKKCFYFSQAGCQAVYLLRLLVSGRHGENLKDLL